MTNWKKYGVSFEEFSEEITQKWIDNHFSREECKEWLDVGLKAEDSSYCCWLRDIKKKDAKWILDFGNEELKKEFNNYSREIVGIRNILLFGWMGEGKSTLANVLAKTDEFEEGAGISGKTRETKKKNFEYKGIKYRVIDTVGAGDTKSSEKIFLNEIVSNIYTKDGINQIFFVLGGRISEKEIKIYNSFKKTIFDKDIDKFVTIVCTKFSEFNDKQKCLEEKEEFEKNFKEKLRISNITFVDNPSNDLKKREVSRSILLEYLNNNCQETYRPKKMLIDFANIDFFNLKAEQGKHLLNLEKLEELKIENKNKKKGSLKPLLNMTKLKKLDIRGTTGIESGLEYLPDSCEIFLCDSSSKVAKVLGKYGSNEEYSITRWKKDIKDILGNSYNTKNDIRKFFGSWSQKEVSKLKNHQQLLKYRFATELPQWVARASLVGGGILSLVGVSDGNLEYIKAGGIISIVAPFVEALASYADKWYYEKNEGKWELFILDSRELWNDYQELVEFLEPFELVDDSTKENTFSGYSLEGLNHKFWNLRGEIVRITSELKQSKKKEGMEVDLITKKQFAKDLQKNWAKRKEEWKGVGEKLVEIDNYYHRILQEDVQQHDDYSDKVDSNNRKNKEVKIDIESSDNEDVRATGRRFSLTTTNRRKSISHKKIPKEGEFHELTELNKEKDQSQVNIEIPPK